MKYNGIKSGTRRVWNNRELTPKDFVTPVVEHWLEQEIGQWVHPMKDRSDDPLHHEWTLYLWATSCSTMGSSLALVGYEITQSWPQRTLLRQLWSTGWKWEITQWIQDWEINPMTYIPQICMPLNNVAR